jgi:hypothetical protein
LTPHHDSLLDLNTAILRWLLGKFKSTATVEPTTDYDPAPSIPDYRNAFSPKRPLPAEGFPKYYQVFADRLPFAHNLSILDLMMNLGPEANNYLKTLTL